MTRRPLLTLTLSLSLLLIATGCDKKPVAPADTPPATATTPEPPSTDAAPAGEAPPTAAAADTKAAPALHGEPGGALAPPGWVEGAAAVIPSGTPTYTVNGWTLALGPHVAVLQKEGQPQRVLYDEASAMRECKEDQGDGRDSSGYEYHITGQLLHIAADTFAYTITENGYCGGAHPFVSTNYVIVKPGEEDSPTLATLFDPAEVNAAIASNALIQAVRAPEAMERDDCELAVIPPEDANASGFAIAAYDGTHAEIHVAMQSSFGACRAAFRVAKLRLKPKTPAIAAALQEAHDKQLLLNTLATPLAAEAAL